MLEIERKFLVDECRARDAGAFAKAGVQIRQGYLAESEHGVVRVRAAGDRAFLTVKGPTRGITRSEFEYEIPVADAEAILSLCSGEIVSKTRHIVEVRGHRWEVDVFGASNRGLIVAEIELDRENEAFERPEWLGREVSHLPRYANSSLSRRPYLRWTDEEKLDGTDEEKS